MARGWSSAPLLAGLFAAACGIPPPSSPQKLDVYLYEDTRQLVESVDSAAGLLETRGATAAFAEFGRPGSREQRSAAHVYVPRRDFDYAINVGLRMLLMRHLVDESEGLYLAREKELPLLRYYANSIAHLLAQSSILQPLSKGGEP